MGRKTVSIVTCDRCGKESADSNNFNDGNTSGVFDLQFGGSLGVKSYDGAWGGRSYSEDYVLCCDCGTDFLDFMKGTKTNG